MFLNPRMNLFKFEFTKNFMPMDIRNKYYKYLNHVIGSPISEPLDYINYGIQGINLPGLSYDPVEQIGEYGRIRKHRSSIHDQEMYAKEMTVTFRMMDGFINYWIMVDILRYYYDYYGESKETRYIPDQQLEIIDGDGHVITSVDLRRVLYTNISDLNLNFSSNNPEFNTFDVTLVYNELEIKQLFDSAV